MDLSVELTPVEGDERLLAYVSVTFENVFVVKDMRLIRGDAGMFLSMPSRQLKDRCPGCKGKNPVVARYCSWCGKRLADHGRAKKDEEGRPVLYADICHPVDSGFRKLMEEEVLIVYKRSPFRKETWKEENE